MSIARASHLLCSRLVMSDQILFSTNKPVVILFLLPSTHFVFSIFLLLSSLSFTFILFRLLSLSLSFHIHTLSLTVSYSLSLSYRTSLSLSLNHFHFLLLSRTLSVIKSSLSLILLHNFNYFSHLFFLSICSLALTLFSLSFRSCSPSSATIFIIIYLRIGANFLFFLLSPPPKIILFFS